LCTHKYKSVTALGSEGITGGYVITGNAISRELTPHWCRSIRF